MAKRSDIAPEKALQLFYESQTCADLHDKTTGLYLYGDLYVADEFMREMGEEVEDELTANGANYANYAK